MKYWFAHIFIRLRVAALMERNSYLGEKRRFCECVTMITGLSIFTAFTLYIVFSYGFTIFGKKHPFNVVEPSESATRNGTKSLEVRNLTALFVVLSKVDEIYLVDIKNV